MNEPRREQPDDIIPLTLDDSAYAEAPERHAPAAPTSRDIENMSPEARLATALVMQAQALEGMRRTQDDLMRRVSAGGGGVDDSLVDSIDRFHDRLDDVRDGQRSASREVRRMRRRSRMQLAVAVGSLVVVLGVAFWWLAGVVADGGDNDELLVALQAAQVQQEEAVTDALQQSTALTEERLKSERQTLLAGLRTDLDHRDELVRAQLSALTAERDHLAERLTGAEVKAADLTARIVGLTGDLSAAEHEIAGLRDERLSHLGEMTRLRNKTLEQELQREELLATLEELRLRSVVVPVSAVVGVSSDSGFESLAERLNAVLASGGAAAARFAEAGAVREGAVREVIMVRLDAEGLPLDSVSGDRAVVVGGPEGPRLEVWVDAPVSAVVLSMDLADADLSALALEGLDVPAAVVSLEGMRSAFGQLLALHDHRLLELGGRDGPALLDVVIEGEGRRLWAARAEVSPEGPTLVLTDGESVIGGESRPFFRGVMRLPLPRADFGAWQAALAVGG